MAKKTAAQEPAIRKSLLITGGVAIAAMLLGFIVMNFVLGGNGGGDVLPVTTPAASVAPAAAETPQPSDVPGLNPGGRDPFALGISKVRGLAAP